MSSCSSDIERYNESTASAAIKGSAPWYVLPDSVWLMLLRDWLHNDRDVVNVALTEKASHQHPVIQKWNCLKFMSLSSVARLNRFPLPPKVATSQNPSSSSSSSIVLWSRSLVPRHTLRVGYHGVIRRIIVGSSEIEAKRYGTKTSELPLLPLLSEIAERAHELVFSQVLNSRLDHIDSFPLSLRALTISHSVPQIAKGGEDTASMIIPTPIGQLFPQIPLLHALTDLNLSNLIWSNTHLRDPLNGLQLPASLKRLRLPTSEFPFPKALHLPLGLETLSTGGGCLVDEIGWPEFDDSGSDYIDPTLGLTWPLLPSSLTELYCNSRKGSLQSITLPRGLRLLSIKWEDKTSPSFDAWPPVLPPVLETLEVICSDLAVNLLTAYLPQSLQRLSLRGQLELNSTTWTLPSSLTELDLTLVQHEKFYKSRLPLPEPSQIEIKFRPNLMILPDSLASNFPSMDHTVLSQIKLPSDRWPHT